jgi:hypothetical protein
MPIEIRELTIKVDVTPPQAGAATRAGTPSAPQPIAPAERRAIIDECVERVLDALREREEP